MSAVTGERSRSPEPSRSPRDARGGPAKGSHERQVEWSGLTVARFSQVFRGVLEDGLRPLGLTATQYLALRLVQHVPGLTNAELARELLVTPQTMIRVVGGLTGRGLIERAPNPRHGRLLETRLTPAGTRLLERAVPLADAAELRVLAPLTQGQRARLLASLRRCIRPVRQELASN